ncbi:hypothetical protein BC829DRAFT_387444 [Chytridium lagenaria]|nr:hypothetical protein BC829DRAFT_387444 [Chytridium lagenaria]
MYHCPHEGCDKTFTRRYNLQSHLRCHSGERPFNCRFCTATFSRKHDLRRHTRPHHCRHCNLSFARSDALKRHLSSEAKRAASGLDGARGNPHPPAFNPATWEEEHGIFQGPCRSSSADSHHPTYIPVTKERDATPSDNDEPSSSSSSPPAHPSSTSPTTPPSPTHTGYPCPECPQTFSRKHDLQRHVRSLHTWDRPYKCMHCPLTFARSDALKRHLSGEAKKGDGRHPCFEEEEEEGRQRLVTPEEERKVKRIKLRVGARGEEEKVEG